MAAVLVLGNPFDVERLAVYLDMTMQGNLLGDQSFRKASRLCIFDQVRELILSLVAINCEISSNALPFIEYRALDYGATQVIAHYDTAFRIADFQFHHVRVPRNLSE